MNELMRYWKLGIIFCFVTLMTIHGCTLLHPVMIAGRVTDASTGSPIPGARIEVTGTRYDEPPTAVTNADGKFSIHVVATSVDFGPEMPEWTLTFAASGYQSGSSLIDFAALSDKPETIDAVVVSHTLTRKEAAASSPSN